MTLPAIFRTRPGVVWLCLVAATAVSFTLGTENILSGHDGRTIGVCVVLAVAFAKIHFIGMEFMELRAAPLVLKVLFNGWCVVVGTTVISLYVAGQ